MNVYIEKILSIPKSFYVCLKLLPILEAIRLPILCRYNVKCISLKGHVRFSSKSIKSRMLLIGFGSVGIFDKSYERTLLEIEGDLIVGKMTFIGHGSRISIARGASVSIGDNFINTAMMTLVCKQKIRIGSNVLASWNILIMDTDMHRMINPQTKQLFEDTIPILVGNNVWLCTRCVILKGSCIPDGCIVGANSLVSKSFISANTLIAGNPAIEKKHNITRLIEYNENFSSNDFIQ